MHILLRKFSSYLYAGFVSVIFCIPASAQSPELVSQFSGQRVLYSSVLNNDVHSLTLSALQKINGEWIADTEHLIDGRAKKYTLELTRPYTQEKAWLRIQSFMKKNNGRLLFECESLDCGSSNAWANERFGIKQLYGLDLSQQYQVWRVENRFVAVYLVQRGNRRIYLQIDSIYPLDPSVDFMPSASVLTKQLYQSGELELLGLTFEQGNLRIDASVMASYAKALNKRGFKKFSVIAEDSLPGSDEDRSARAQSYAEAVKNALIDQGVKGSRMTLESRPAPAASESGARVIVRLAN